MESELRCNICDETISYSAAAQHVAGRNHAVKRKVAEFQEMNALAGRAYQQDTSILKIWLRDLHNHDFLSSGSA